MANRQYALYQRARGERRWWRCEYPDGSPYPSYVKERAVYVYQSQLIDSVMGSFKPGFEIRLRPVPAH